VGAVMLLGLLLVNIAIAGKVIVTNNLRITYDVSHEVKPYIANEIKIIKDDDYIEFDSNKFRVGARYKINDHIRIDPHLFVDNKRKDSWVFSPGPAVRIDFTF